MQAEGGFLQRIVAGTDKGIAFSALNGELLGAMVCTKTIIDSKRKLVSGELESVSPEVHAGLERFVRDTHWTGGENNYQRRLVALTLPYLNRW